MEYIKRFVEEDFKEWKERYSRFTLEVVGCRQVGKTTTVLHFAKENYDTKLKKIIEQAMIVSLRNEERKCS